MTTPRVWVSTSSRDVVLGPDGPGAHWQDVGTINTTRETDLWKNVQVFLGLRASSPHLTGFYLDGDAEHPWIINADEDDSSVAPFWLAIDPYGDRSRYLVTLERASLGALARRPPEAHPGRLKRPIALAVRVKKKDNRIFEFHSP